MNVVILYPKGRVSEIQELQLTTLGKNVSALEIDGYFDECQEMVKKSFLDSDLNKKLMLTSVTIFLPFLKTKLFPLLQNKQQQA